MTKPVEAIKGVAHKVVSLFKNLLGIKSPSRVFMGFGFNLLEGLFEGIRKLQNKPLSAISQVAQTLRGVFEKAFPPSVKITGKDLRIEKFLP